MGNRFAEGEKQKTQLLQMQPPGHWWGKQIWFNTPLHDLPQH
jgi:hypothetical protein